jgi:hypothetical protein
MLLLSNATYPFFISVHCVESAVADNEDDSQWQDSKYTQVAAGFTANVWEIKVSVGDVVTADQVSSHIHCFCYPDSSTRLDLLCSATVLDTWQTSCSCALGFDSAAWQHAMFCSLVHACRC